MDGNGFELIGITNEAGSIKVGNICDLLDGTAAGLTSSSTAVVLKSFVFVPTVSKNETVFPVSYLSKARKETD